jgi:hypothetical protein
MASAVSYFCCVCKQAEMEGGALHGASPWKRVKWSDRRLFARTLAVALCVVVIPGTHAFLVGYMPAAPFACSARGRITLVSPRLRLNSMGLRYVRVAGKHCEGQRRRTQTRMNQQDKSDVDRLERREAIVVRRTCDRIFHARAHTDHDKNCSIAMLNAVR